MTKRKVNILITLMAIALVGIIYLQLAWMKNAIDVRNELFNRGVVEAINKTTKRLETISDVFFVKDLVKTNSPEIIKRRSKGPSQIASERVIHVNDSILFEFKNSPNIIRNKNSEIIISSESNDTLNREFNIQFIQLDSVVLGLEERIEQNITVMVDNSKNQLGKDSSVIVHWQEFNDRVNKKTNRLKNVAGRMVYETWGIDQNQVPDTSSIGLYLKEELQKQEIPINFEMGIYYGKNGFIKTHSADSMRLEKSNFNTNLYPNEIFDRGEKLHIYFPNQRAYIFKTMLLPAFLSLIFCTFIMVVFGLSIFYIQNQKKISEMKSDFINNMTHEFKTPLATISVATDTIINPKIIRDDEKIKHFAAIIKKENKRMNQQVETILQIARFDKKDFELNFEVLNIHQLIEKSIQINALHIDKREGTITSRFEAVNATVTTDPIHALNVLNNLIDNANKYSPNKPEILIKTANSERGVWIKISDKGIGMSKHVQQKIFEKFYRETSGNIHNVKGFGLGLSYAKAVLEANHGQISVTSEAGNGSTFDVFFPFELTT